MKKIENCTSCTERLEQYFEVNEIAKEKQVPALLSLIGGKTHTLLRNLTTPDKPKDKSYADIVKIPREHLSPALVIAENFRFHKRDQKENESTPVSRGGSYQPPPPENKKALLKSTFCLNCDY